uniref:Voltage-dependent anion-selective channel protein 1 n=2 Tax=Schistocephalus solidus TaxID=70667 RepID=A0A0X3Q4P6_SCHSO
MSLSSFGDLGKAVKDVLTQHFKTSIFNFDYKSKIENNVGVHVECSCDEYSQTAAVGDITFRLADGIFVKTTIDNNMKLTNDVEISEKIKGTKHNIVCSVDKEGEKNLKLKSCLKQNYVNADIEVDFASQFPCAVGSVVLGEKGYLAGAQLSVDTNGFEVKEYVYSLGYIGKGFQLHGFLTNHRDINVKFYQSRSYVDIGFNINWNGSSKITSLCAAVAYKPDNDTFLKARVDERGAINLACGIQVIPGNIPLELA